MLLSLLPRTLLVPPIVLLGTAVIGALLEARARARAGRWLLWASLLGLVLLAMPIVPRLMRSGLDDGISLQMPGQDSPKPPQAIVVLSADGAFGAPAGGIFAGPRLGSLSLQRVLAGAALQARTGLPMLMSGGAFNGGPQTLAAMMGQMMHDDLHIDVRWLENRSTDTWGNAEYSAAMLATDGVTSVFLVSDSWHLRRARIAFAHFGLTVWPAPVATQEIGLLEVADFVPSVQAWVDSYYALHEWIGCAVYALRS